MPAYFALLLASLTLLTAPAQKPLVIVELFTAEGCSSCPSADDLLKEMSEILNKEGKPVVGLSFHVTYWNRLGWVDPYSNETYTDRQKAYNTSLGTNQLYTPQAVVNGASEFIGSNPIAFRKLVLESAEKAYGYDVQAQFVLKDGKAVLEYDLNKDPKQILLNVAVVENYVEHFVPKGENKDRTLKHTNIVRSFKTMKPEKRGSILLEFPEGLTPENGKVIVYLQNWRTMHVDGATIATY